MNLNPVLSEIQGLSPAAQAALGMAGHVLPQAAPNATVIAPQLHAQAQTQDAGPAPTLSPMHMESPAPVLSAPQAPNVSGPILGTTQGDSLNRQAIMGHGAGVENISKNIEGSGFGQRHPLLGKILGGVTEGAGMLGDTLLHAASPGLERDVPGTEGNYARTLGRANAALTQDEANAKDESQTASENATAQHTNAETPEVVPEAQARIGQENAQAKNLESETEHRGDVKDSWKEVAGYTGPKGEPLEINEATGETRPASVPAGTHAATKETNPQQQTFDSLIKGGMTPMQAYEKIREKPAGVSQAGTWTLAEGEGGKPTLYNSKTGEMKDAPAGLQKAGTQAKKDAATEPAKQAMEYANDYASRTVHTGPGDEALMEKFFELAKPSTGFRMSQPQIDMLKNAQSWMGGLEAHLRHATSGTWFSDEQRKEIAGTMQDLAKAKGLDMQPQGGAAPQRPAGVPENYQWNAQGNGGKGSWRAPQ